MCICIVDGCLGKVRSLNSTYCEMHYYRLRRNGSIELPPRAVIRDTAFTDMEQGEAWVLGLIWTDGCLDRNRISITSKDKEILEQAEAILQGERCVKKRSSCNAYDLAATNKTVASQLRSMGLSERKSHSIRWPVGLSPDLEWHFLRGVFDGDGCVCIRNDSSVSSLATSIVSASEDFFCSICCKWKEFGVPFSTSCRSTKNGHLYTIISCLKGSRMLFDLMYNYDFNINYMKRKKSIFDKILKLTRPKIGRPHGLATTSKFSDIEDDIIQDYLHVSKTVAKTAAKFNVSESVVCRAMQTRGVVPYSGRSILQRLDKTTKLAILNDHSNGMTFKQIEARHKLSRHITRKILRSA